MKRRTDRKLDKRRGLTLLELIIASTLLAMLLTSVSFILRASRQTWEAQQDDFSRLDAMHAVSRHLTREVRRAKSVTAISAANEAAGTLSIRLPDNSLLSWRRDGGSDSVYTGGATADQLLAQQITSLKFIGYKADGVTATTDPTLIHNVVVEVGVTLPRASNGGRTVRSWIWVRSW